ncbi:uncharacterized protein SETTUDRAFT_167486, partial [Exserohilum turcica Et28A]
MIRTKKADRCARYHFPGVQLQAGAALRSVIKVEALRLSSPVLATSHSNNSNGLLLDGNSSIRRLCPRVM